VLINVDAQIGRFVDRYPEANVILMSDHGSRRIKNAFLLGKWLAGQGYAVYGEKSLDIPPYEINFVISRYLQAQGMNGVGERVVRGLLKGALSALPRAVRRPIWERMHRAAPQVLDYRFDERLDFVRTRVFATSNSGPLIINRNPPGQKGGIGDKEYEALRAALIRDLMAIKDPGTGEPVFSHVYRREEIYHGPAMARAPDLVVDHYSSACDLIEDRNPDWFWFVNRLNRFGDHVRDGLFVLSGPDFEQDPGSGYRASIMDLPATLLHLYDVSIPEDFDGQVLAGFLASDRPVQTQATGGSVGALTGDYSDAEREQMIERLRALGYL
jgi:predicted AlkP superfamily phosphohydrolase/phosphomutase